jgi:predicted nuclease of predicted toxin-antitoxin system
MKLKLDENLGERGREILSRGHDVTTVASQSLQKAEDAKLIERCRREGRVLVSLDLDFANPLHFGPAIIPASPFCDCHANPRAKIC